MATTERIRSSSGVQVLRAMFENGKPSSPADRVRNDSRERDVSATSLHDAEAESKEGGPRPLNKVRTAFISVEDDGREMSRERGREGASKLVVLNGTPGKDEGAASVDSDAKPKASTTQVDAQNAASQPSEVSLGEHQKPSASSNVSGLPTTPKSRSTPGSKQPANLSVPKLRAAAQESGTKSPRGLRKSSANVRANLNSDMQRSPKAQQTLASATTVSSPSFARNTSSNAAIAKSHEIQKSSNSPRKSAPSLPGTRSATGFVKPKPRSPTRPVTLPSHLTAATASSAAKRLESSASQEPQHGERSRRPSTYSIASSRPSLSFSNPTTASASMARKPSATFGPPPWSKAQQQSQRAASSSRPSDSFLARMMRPTASSASKTSEHKDGAAIAQRPRVASRPKQTPETATPSKPKARRGQFKVAASFKNKADHDVKQEVTNVHATLNDSAPKDGSSSAVDVEPVATNGDDVAAGAAALDDEIVEVVVASEPTQKPQDAASAEVDDSVD